MSILYFELDALNPTHPSCYGYPRQTSPNLDRLAASGVRAASPEGTDLVVPAVPEPKAHIVQALAQAYRWHEELGAGEGDVPTIAQRENITASYIYRRLRLTLLGPPVLAAALSGSLPPRVTLDDLLRAARQLDWGKQSAELGLPLERRIDSL